MVALRSTRRLGKSERFTETLAGKKKTKKKETLEENQNKDNSQVTESGCVIGQNSHAKNAIVDIYQCGEEVFILSE